MCRVVLQEKNLKSSSAKKNLWLIFEKWQLSSNFNYFQRLKRLSLSRKTLWPKIKPCPLSFICHLFTVQELNDVQTQCKRDHMMILMWECCPWRKTFLDTNITSSSSKILPTKHIFFECGSFPFRSCGASEKFILYLC